MCFKQAEHGKNGGLVPAGTECLTSRRIGARAPAHMLNACCLSVLPMCAQKQIIIIGGLIPQKGTIIILFHFLRFLRILLQAIKKIIYLY